MSNDDDMEHIPSIVPSRDDALRGGDRKAAAGPRAPRREAAAAAPSATSGLWTRLFLVVALATAAAACAWAWQLEEQLVQAGFEMERYAQRIGDLEARLADTDQGLSQNTTAMAIKIKELYSEVDKLWASAWRKNKAKLEELEGSAVARDERLAKLDKSMGTATGQLQQASADIVRLKAVAGDLERLMASAKSNQQDVERVADTLNKVNLDFSRLAKRVEANEGWIESINAFRRQVNTSITQLEGSVRALQQPGAPAS